MAGALERIRLWWPYTEVRRGELPRLTDDQKRELKTLLETKDPRYLGDVIDLIKTNFKAEYSERPVRRILKGMGMKHAKPYQVDYRKPDDAEEKLKKTMIS